MRHPSPGATESIDGGGDDECDEAEDDESGGEVVVGLGARLRHLARRRLHLLQEAVTEVMRSSLDPQGHFSRAPSFPEFPAAAAACLSARNPQIRLPQICSVSCLVSDVQL